MQQKIPQKADNDAHELSITTQPTQFYAKLIADHCSDAIAILDENVLTEWVNDPFLQMSEYALSDCLGRHPDEYLYGPETSAEALKELRNAISERRTGSCEILQYKKSGEAFWVDLKVTPIFNNDGLIEHYLAIYRDITKRKILEAEREASLKNEKFRQNERRILSKTTEWLYAARSLEDLYNVVERCAPKLMPETSGALFIYSNSRDVIDFAIGWGDVESPAHVEPDDCWALRRGRSYHYGHDEIEFPCEHFHKDITSSFCLPLLAHGETIGLLWCHTNQEHDYPNSADPSSFWDVALMLAEQISLTIANVRLRQELQDRSVKDPLTGLWNRRYFMDSLRREKARADGTRTGFALVSIDIDQFKQFNDHHGHDAGDLILRRVTSELVTATGSAGMVCRVGGEEISVICPEMGAGAAASLAEKLRAAVKRIEVVYQGQALPGVTISAGVATYPADHGTIEQVIRNADQGLYQAKRTGRDKVIVFDADNSSNWMVAQPNRAAS